jgi:hypothetical protein
VIEQYIYLKLSADVGVVRTPSAVNRELAIFKIANALHSRCPWESASTDGLKAFQMAARLPNLSISQQSIKPLKMLTKRACRGSA